MDQSKFLQAINLIAEEKGLSKEKVIQTVEAALAAAYRKDYGNKEQNIKVVLDQITGGMDIYLLKEVVEEVENEESQMTEKEAQKYNKGAKVGDTIEIECPAPAGFGRIAAQTAKQVIIQRIREAEREVVFEEYEGKEGQLVNGVIQRLEGRNVILDIGKTNGIIFPSGQVEGERYRIGQRMKVLIEKVEQTSRGPQVVVSRSDAKLIEKLFELEVPEISAGTVEIKSIAREAGSRTKIAILSAREGVDPVGSCVGQRGTRVQAVMAELADEKIDCILWDQDPINFIVNALSPAKVTKVGIDEKSKEAKIFVPADQLSLAIGKNGQNVRLAVKLTGWKIDVEPEEEEKKVDKTKKKEDSQEAVKEDKKTEEKDSKNTKKTKK
ncbi:transcription termination/antitermination protein NusA [bacterium CG_4_10_14_0_2_um_filter_33_32]|nr:MAG: transcription termination/antitermination protein NusA [bacterium CG_4_8_14_3_um_filter_33_28]PIZ86617.1 MAG: transcription termination/antitermination protein NusA [bacterium CG_4_10_14_0_2_um_filter_33_32]PJA72681.1 MAG: transcription termination/antitermination protein NusA [bacterium CG_4_9_14_3_um_filter_33_26]